MELLYNNTFWVCVVYAGGMVIDITRHQQIIMVTDTLLRLREYKG